MRKRIIGLTALAGIAGTIFVLPPLAADTDDDRLGVLSAEVEALRQGQHAIREQLDAIRDWMTRAPLRGPVAADAETEALHKELAAMKKIVADAEERERKVRLARLPVRDSDFTMRVADDPSKGAADAPVTLVEFTDFQCPYCARHKKNTMPELLKNYVETGKVRYILRDYPLAFHPHAAKAAEAAHCAGEQDRYWEMSDQLFGNQRALMEENLPEYAKAARVEDMLAFQACLDSGKFAVRGQDSLAEGAKAGVSGTPSFLVGVTGPDGVFKSKRFIRGAQSYKVFEEAIQEVLSAPRG